MLIIFLAYKKSYPLFLYIFPTIRLSTYQVSYIIIALPFKCGIATRKKLILLSHLMIYKNSIYKIFWNHMVLPVSVWVYVS